MADIQAKVNTVDRSSYSSNTDIIGALQNASKDIEDKKDIYQSQSILILSDMMQYADNGLKMCATESIENWMSKLPKCKAVQKGMPVAIVTGSQANMNTEMYSKIQNFWTQFFQIQGAELICYNSAQNTSLDKLFKIE